MVQDFLNLFIVNHVMEKLISVMKSGYSGKTEMLLMQCIGHLVHYAEQW
jgi:hypothetical protein